MWVSIIMVVMVLNNTKAIDNYEDKIYVASAKTMNEEVKDTNCDKYKVDKKSCIDKYKSTLTTDSISKKDSINTLVTKIKIYNITRDERD